MTYQNNLVTVYITTYNRLILLRRAVESVLNQTYKSIELLIVDDGSTDGTHEYLNELSRKHKNIKFLINSSNSGACYGRNKAILNASGEYITGLDDDDYFVENRISDFINEWKNKKPSVIALYSSVKKKEKADKYIKCDKKSLVKRNQLFFNNDIGNQVFTKTKIIKSINGFDTDMPAWQDLECWIRLLSLGDAQCVNNYSYIVDVSHPHERITLQKTNKIQLACNHLVSKHNLTKRQKSRLVTQLIPYAPSYYKLTPHFINAFLQLDFMLICKLLNFLIKFTYLNKNK
ncbi:hypothetical protein tinsulaeT_09110 [Thalassotalea insulae]|uniref:Glycosyltransferase 2-like domain-containing protein n=1 Tax=Thalassotalea insulae TaxID=2056778 RepID=A0ABQ6GTS6_9GAMM|nr:glycosyltransferase [Thalassotalea insulae]GLX77571.1 hypothetical protein tinsulaeT_09110 [Thalassotalea insulae]